jgi:hypothetical protein
MMSVQNFRNNSIINTALDYSEIPHKPPLKKGDIVFFYGSEVRRGSLSLISSGHFGFVAVSLAPPMSMSSDVVLRNDI